MKHPLFRTVVGVVALPMLMIALSGCAHTGSGGDAAMDTVSGYYAGDWYGPDPTKPAGELYCTITPNSADTWDALFVALFGERGEYEVPLEGRRVGGSVVFEGEVDLGSSDGGKFQWKGEILDGRFDGEYTTTGYGGTFKMTKTDPPAE